VQRIKIYFMLSASFLFRSVRRLDEAIDARLLDFGCKIALIGHDLPHALHFNVIDFPALRQFLQAIVQQEQLALRARQIG
jgi:hypothetical protein